MEFWKEVRRLVLTNELSRRGACKKYGLGWHTLKKILAHDEPPGYRQSQPREKRKLAPFLPIIQQILEDDRQAPKKQRHTAKRIFQRLSSAVTFTSQIRKQDPAGAFSSPSARDRLLIVRPPDRVKRLACRAFFEPEAVRAWFVTPPTPAPGLRPVPPLAGTGCPASRTPAATHCGRKPSVPPGPDAATSSPSG